MSLSKALAVGPLVLVMFASGAHAQAPASPPKRDEAPLRKLSEQLRPPGFPSTNRFKALEWDRRWTEVPERAAAGEL